MSDHSITIVPKISSYPNNKTKSKEILNWLILEDIVQPTLSASILGAENGYALSAGARQATTLPHQLPFNLVTNGLEIITERQIFDTGENGIEECICPHCKENIALEDWSFLNDWYEQTTDEVNCPLCNVGSEIHQFNFSPAWGFSDLGFRFWNWPDLTDELIAGFKQRLGCDISVVHTRI